MGQDHSKLSVVRHSDFLWVDRGDFARSEANVGPSTGTPSITQVTGKPLFGFLLNAANEAAEIVFPIPTYWDRRHPLDVFVHWVSDAAITVAFTVSYGFFKSGEAIPSLTAVASTIAAVSASTSLLLDRDGSVAIPASALGADADDLYMNLKVAVTTLPSDDLWFLGAELVHTRRVGFSKFGIKGRVRA